MAESLTRFSRITDVAGEPAQPNAAVSWIMSDPSSSGNQQPQEWLLNGTRTTNLVIDVDSFNLSAKVANQQVSRCQGYILCFPAGKSPYTTYPFSLHNTHALPWDFSIENGVMTLFARACSHFSSSTKRSCQLCLDLLKNKTLEGIHTWMVDGVHKNAQFNYHGFGGLHEVLRHRNEQVEFYQLWGLNQVQALLGKATALSDYKQFMVAIASGKVEWVDWLIHITLAQKKGIRGIMLTWEAAVQGIYNPKSFTEEENMHALLLWRLGGNRVAHINHCSTKAPSVTYLKNHSIMPLIIPSPGKPTILEVQKNVEATFESLLEITSRATEKCIWWDPKTNYFLGLCREHAHNTCAEFINEGDMEEVFQALDNEEVHCVPEVRKYLSVENASIFASASRLISDLFLGNNCSSQNSL